MKINAKDLYIVLEAAKYTLRLCNLNIGYTHEGIQLAVNNIIDSLGTLEFEVREEETKGRNENTYNLTSVNVNGKC